MDEANNVDTIPQQSDAEAPPALVWAPFAADNIKGHIGEVENFDKFVKAYNFVDDVDKLRPSQTSSQLANVPAPQPQRGLNPAKDVNAIAGFEVVGYGACDGDTLYRKMSTLTTGVVENDIVTIAAECVKHCTR